jgi:hypothetical protein
MEKSYKKAGPFRMDGGKAANAKADVSDALAKRSPGQNATHLVDEWKLSRVDTPMEIL